MPVVAPKFTHASDPRDAVWADLGDLKWLKPLWNTVWVANYIPPPKSAGGIILPESAKDEFNYQGKTGLVVALGPRAYVDEPENNIFFHGQKVEVGQWVIFRPSDGTKIQRGDREIRVFQDVHIKAVINGPDDVW